jgi:hypothetical protein
MPDSWKRDWHQFRLLSRDAVRQLLDAALFSRDADPAEYAIWMMALVATPTAFFAMQQFRTFAGLHNAPVEVVEQVALGLRLFFVIYGMLAAALLAALTWEALFPDGRDQEVVGVLPVQPRTFAASRLGAAVTVGVVFAAAVNLPAAFIFSMFHGGHPLYRGQIPGLFTGHVLATMLGSMSVFFALLTLRGLAAIIFGARAGAWLGAALQLITVVLMFEVFFFLPGVLGTLGSRILSGDVTALWFPPVWFAALHAWVTGSANQLLENAMLRGLIAAAIATVVVVPIYLLPAAWLGRRALETRSRERAAATTFVVRTVGRVTSARPAVRSILLFAVASLVRSRRHLLILASYFGIAVAICIASILVIEVRGTFALNTPAEWVLALPMVFLFFAVMGLRASFRIPTEIEANWPFRLAQPSLATCVNASVLVMFTLAILPIAVITFGMLAPRWPPGSVLISVALQMVAGLVLVECALFRWTKVPFACGHAPSPDLLKSWWPAYLMALYVFAFKLSDWQFAATTSPRAFGWYLGIAALVILVVRILRYRKLRTQVLEFDALPQHSMERLNLSGALN